MRRNWLLALDAAAVLLFVAIGRDTHNEAATISGYIATVAPFLIALGLGWAAARAWRSPTSIATGAVVLAVTLVAGMLLRRLVFNEGTAAAFVIVATLFLTLFLMGWRLIAARWWRTADGPAAPVRSESVER